jgi:hypothetical protein
VLIWQWLNPTYSESSFGANGSRPLGNSDPNATQPGSRTIVFTEPGSLDDSSSDMFDVMFPPSYDPAQRPSHSSKLFAEAVAAEDAAAAAAAGPAAATKGAAPRGPPPFDRKLWEESTAEALASSLSQQRVMNPFDPRYAPEGEDLYSDEEVETAEHVYSSSIRRAGRESNISPTRASAHAFARVLPDMEGTQDATTDADDSPRRRTEEEPPFLG